MLPFLICLIDGKQVLHLGIFLFLKLEIFLPGFHLFQFCFSGNREAGVSWEFWDRASLLFVFLSFTHYSSGADLTERL